MPVAAVWISRHKGYTHMYSSTIDRYTHQSCGTTTVRTPLGKLGVILRTRVLRARGADLSLSERLQSTAKHPVPLSTADQDGMRHIYIVYLVIDAVGEAVGHQLELLLLLLVPRSHELDQPLLLLGGQSQKRHRHLYIFFVCDHATIAQIN